MKSFGEIIKKERENRGLLLRQVASGLDVDQALISKFESGVRKPSKEQVEKFAHFYKINEKELLTAWLSDKIIFVIQNEDIAEKALKVAEQKIKYLKIKKNE